MKKENLIITVLLVLLCASVGYSLYVRYQTKLAEQQVLLLRQGIQAGYARAVSEFMRQAGVCQPFSVWMNNQTVQVINTACLQLASANQST